MPFYKPPPPWHFFAALTAALLLEAAAVAVASRQVPSSIPIDSGILPEPPPAEGVFITDLQPEQSPPPDETPPPLPPDLTEPPDFVLEQPASTPRPQIPPTSKPSVATAVAKGARFGPTNYLSGMARLLSAPRPGYPYEARRAKQTGSGKFLLTFDSTGSVRHVIVIQSTGSALLDHLSTSTLQRWRCRPGSYQQIYVPITFTLTGAQL